MAHLVMRDRALSPALDAPCKASVAPNAPSETAPRPALALELVTSLRDFAALETEWDGLFAESAMPGQAFQKFGWCWHWATHYFDPNDGRAQLAIVTGRIAGRLSLVLPLVVNRVDGIRQLNWLVEPVSQYGDILASVEARRIEALQSAWTFAAVATKADCACLRKVRQGSLAARLLEHLASTTIDSAEAPYLSLAGDTSFQAWEQRRQPKARKNRRRQARRLADLGEVRYEKHAGTDHASQLARMAAILKRQSLDDKGAISPTVTDPRFAAFFSDVAAAGEAKAATSVYAVTTAGEPAALKVLLSDGETRYLHIAAFDPRFEKCGAGALLLEHVISAAIADGCATLDLLAPRHGYKMDFADGVVRVDDHVLAITTKGFIYAHLVMRQRGRAKAFLQALPAPMRRILSRCIG
ncbi:MAG: GNAT family N-acetyltransferase [Hyphomicrobiaceae bacterium]